ncbi:unnamed protein product [Adineta steineri]|uniref:Uncharacterized protein n=1 Tax=Adineta steineri TaxID=433720 RepID=A0A813N6L1_9BILA|nr:unnamed protein product [Adineta steineri]
MFVFYKETTRTLKYSPTRKKRKASNLLLSTSSITTAVVATTQHRRCYLPSTSTTPSYSVLIFSAADILFRLTEGFVGQVEEVQRNCFRKIMSSRHSNQENSSIYESNRSRRQISTPSNLPCNQQELLNSSSPSHSDQAPKACCFCWCCCCSCSCSARPKKPKEKEHVTLVCVDSAGGSKDDDSDEGLTITAVINSTSLQIQKKREKEEEEEEEAKEKN